MIALCSLICLLSFTKVLSDQTNDSSYETILPSIAPSLPYYPALDIVDQNLMYSTSTEASLYSTSTESSETTTVLTPLQFYQTNWCQRMLRSSAPNTIPDSLNVTQFQEKYVIPGYWSLWYRSCYLPHRSANIVSTIGDRVLGIASSVMHRIVGTANTAFDPETAVIRDMLIRPISDHN